MDPKNKTYNILIVDDDSDFRLFVSRALATHDLNIQSFEASGGIEAISRINNQQFDIVMTDLDMPGMNGQTLLSKFKTVKEEFKPLHTIIVSQHVDKEVIKKGQNGTSILKKPFDTEKLHKYVEIVLLSKKIKKKVKEVKIEKDIEQDTIDVNYVNPFLKAAIDIFYEKAQLESSKDFVFIREENDTLGEITGLIPISCDKYSGSLAITFPHHLFLDIMNRIQNGDSSSTKDEISETDKNIFKEICHEIFERGKEELGVEVTGLTNSLPEIITGENHLIPHVVDTQILAVYFNTEFGEYVMECCLKEKRSKDTKSYDLDIEN